MKIFVIGLTFLFFYIPISYADIPNCLSGICKEQVYTDDEIENMNFSVLVKDKCRSFAIYQKNFDNINLKIWRSLTDKNDNLIGEIFKIERRIIIIDKDSEFEKNEYSLPKGHGYYKIENILNKIVMGYLNKYMKLIKKKYGEPMQEKEGRNRIYANYGERVPGRLIYESYQRIDIVYSGSIKKRSKVVYGGDTEEFYYNDGEFEIIEDNSDLKKYDYHFRSEVRCSKIEDRKKDLKEVLEIIPD